MNEVNGATPRVAVLWNQLSGYFHACLQALHREGVEVLVFHRAAGAAAPFDAAVTEGLRAHVWTDRPDGDELQRAIDEFAPDALLVCSWSVGGYRKVARSLRGRTLRILAMDNQWLGTVKQWAGVAVAPFVIRPTYDAVFLPGETQARFARKLGFPAERTLWGLYSADYDVFDEVAEKRGDSRPPKVFLFVGRLVREKGIDVLAAAYQRYRSQTADPWPLLVAGTGSGEEVLAQLPGVERLGFVQPAALPEVMARAGCLVLPSRFEPWATVIHEATAAGLAVVCTDVCGASTRLVLDGYNGVVVTAGEVDALVRALQRIHGTSDQEWTAIVEASRRLAAQFTPTRWADMLLSGITRLRAELGLATA